MKAGALLALLAFAPVALGDTPMEMPTPAKDVPLAVVGSTPLYDIRPIIAGDLSPVSGRVMSADTYVKLAQRIQYAETERDTLKSGTPGSVPWPLVVVLCVLATSGGVYLGVKTAQLLHK